MSVSEELLSLRTNGLKSFEVTASNANISVTPAIVEEATTALRTHSNELRDSISDFRDQEATLEDGWEGATKEALQECLPPLITLFEEVPDSIDSVANWADEHAYNLCSNDMRAANAIRGTL